MMAAIAFAPAALAQRGVQINTDANGANIVGDAANEPSFAINPLNPLHMVVGWREFPTIESDARYAGYAITLDGGRTWHNGGTLDPPPQAPNSQQSDPVLAVDAAGVFFYNSLAIGGELRGVTVYRSGSGGFSWDMPVYIAEDCCDKNWYAADHVTGHHYCVWQPFGDFARSTDGGRTWGRWEMGVQLMAFVHAGPEGEVYIGWPQGRNILIRRSDNARDPNVEPEFGPATYVELGRSAAGLPVNPAGYSGQPSIATNRRLGRLRGWVYVLCSVIPSDDVCDVMFGRSTDGGQTWSTPVRVNDDSPGKDYQWMASMSVAPSGRIDAVWFDTRDDPNHFISRLYYSYSWDGGDTWSRNRPVGDPWDPSLGYPGGQRKIGDYFQCQSDNGSVSVIHPATFNGEQDIYFQRLHPTVLEVSPLIAGQPAQFDVREARPNERAWLVYSTTGPGYVNVGALNVPVNLARPQLGLGPRTADAFGNVSFTATIPPQSRGRRVWFQAIQRENASNVVEDVVQ
ncbi:MAG: glycoside hydrolase [Phycisphaerales bacterium]|nr:glycoside hydrolase [Phycisphaerales bacterium]